MAKSGHKFLEFVATATATTAMTNQSTRRPRGPIGSRGFTGLLNGFIVERRRGSVSARRRALPVRVLGYKCSPSMSAQDV